MNDWTTHSSIGISIVAIMALLLARSSFEHAYCRFHLRLNIAFCVRPLTLIDFNTKRALTHAQWPTEFSNASEISSILAEQTCFHG